MNRPGRIREWLADAIGAFGLVFVIMPALQFLAYLFN
jgi:hypothetical protein